MERGPEVLCVEGIDLPEGVDLDSLRIDSSAAPTERDGTVYVTGRLLDPTDPHWPYRVDAPTAGQLPDPGSGFGQIEVEVALYPYHQWAERAPTSMRVWLPLAPDNLVAPEAARRDMPSP